MISDHNSYFDEAYFQRGDERGTAYRDYVRGADESLTFREIAQAVVTLFRPQRCLEIGCATGAIVRSLNELGVDAHGIDVSEWAILNKLHPNVRLAGAESLPFDDGVFDLVISCHALEHIPPTLAERAFAEMSRVAAPLSHQFHMLPIIGTHPYDYDHEAARTALRADPTHNLLETMQWWRERWEHVGWNQRPINITLYNDTSSGELSAGQFTFGRGQEDAELTRRAFEWNGLVHRQQHQKLEAIKFQQSRPNSIADTIASVGGWVAGHGVPWIDAGKIFSHPVGVAGGSIDIIVEIIGPRELPMRIALIDDSKPGERGVMEHWVELKPGVSSLKVAIDDFSATQGNPDLGRIDKFYLGGNLGDAEMRIFGILTTANGSRISLS